MKRVLGLSTAYILLYVVCVCVCESCNQKALESCVARVNAFTEMFGHHTQIAGLAKDYFDSKCALLDEAAACARPILKQCHSVHEAYVDGQLQAQEYLCDNVDVYLRHQSCLSNSLLQQDISKCMYTEQHYEEAENNKKLCSHVDHDLDCVETHVYDRCRSREAAEFQYQYDYLHVKQLLILLGCDLHSGMSAGAVAAIVIAVLLTICLAACLVVYVLYVRRRNAAASAARPPPAGPRANGTATANGTNGAPPRPAVTNTATDGSTALENPLYTIQNGGGVNPSDGQAEAPPEYAEIENQGKEKVDISSNFAVTSYKSEV